MINRIDAAIKKLEVRLAGIPLDERMPENKRYQDTIKLLQSLRAFKVTIEKMEKMFDELGV